MRKSFAAALTFAMVLGGFLPALAQQGANINGVAQSADKAPLRNYSVQIRNANSGQLVATTTSNQAGEFAFTNLQSGSYVVEIVDASGKVVGLSSAINVGAGATMTVTVNATAAAIAKAKAGGFSLFGLGPTASVAVIGAATAAAVTAVVATRDDASPSR
jgi:hypothetical protein